jgi:hypothetical protein
MLAGGCRVWVKGLAGVWVACQWASWWVVTGQKGLPVGGHRAKGPASGSASGWSQGKRASQCVCQWVVTGQKGLLNPRMDQKRCSHGEIGKLKWLAGCLV